MTRPKHWTSDQISENQWKLEDSIVVTKLPNGDLLIAKRVGRGGLTEHIYLTPEQCLRLDGIANPEKRYYGSKDCAKVEQVDACHECGQGTYEIVTGPAQSTTYLCNVCNHEKV